MEMEGEIKAAKRESMARKGLSDITNSPTAFKILVEDSKLSQAAEITRSYVDQLLQDKKELVKQLEERNKIIELNGMELQRLRGSYQKTQFQNWNLAQSNSQMLAELNIGKEKLKSLQHEIACKNALLRAKSLELERKVAENSVKAAKQEAARKEDDKINTFNRSNRRHQRSQSLGVSNFNKQEATKVENKRHCVRRQSARFVSQECEPAAEKLFEIEETKFPLRKSLQTLMGELSPSSNDDKVNDNSCSSRPERASIGERRPSRRAAEKVQSYKETPVNVKMRRER